MEKKAFTRFLPPNSSNYFPHASTADAGPVYRADPVGLLKPRLERRIPNISLSIIPWRSRRYQCRRRASNIYARVETINRSRYVPRALSIPRVFLDFRLDLATRNTDMTPLNRAKARCVDPDY